MASTVRRVLLAMLAAGTVGVAVVIRTPGTPSLHAVGLEVAVACVFAGAAMIVATRPGGRRPAGLLAATGAGWLLGGLVPALAFVHRGPLIHLLAGYPGGELRSAASRLVVAAGYVLAVVGPLTSPSAASFATGAGLAVLGLAGVGGTRRTVRRRRVAGALLAILIGTVLMAGSGARLFGTPIDTFALMAYELTLVVGAIAIAVDALAGRSDAGLLTQLVIDLGDAGSGGSVRDRLARATGDPDLLLAYRTADGDVDEAGRPVRIEPRGRTVSPIVTAEGEHAVIVHDPFVLGDPRSRALVAAAAHVAVENSRLAAGIRARVAEVDASRLRLVRAGDADRRRIEAEIRAGAGQHLVRAGALLAKARSATPEDPDLDGLMRELEGAATALDEFARGVHPELLTRDGLEPALGDLAGRLALPVELRVASGRLEPAVESTLYFVVAEALTNAAKHAGASRILVRLASGDATTELTVRDDGRGGAQVRPGGGLAGLADRVEALGGALELASSRRGTTLHVRMPRTAGRPALEATSA